MPLQRQALHACPCVAYMSMHVIYACHVLQRQALHVCLQRQALHVLHVVGAGGVLPSIDKDVDADLYPPRHVNELSIAVTRSSRISLDCTRAQHEHKHEAHHVISFSLPAPCSECMCPSSAST